MKPRDPEHPDPAPADELRIDESEGRVRFWIQVSPRSRKTRVGGLYGDALRVHVAPPPVEGKANTACIAALAEALAVRRADIELDASSKNRRKRVQVRGDAKELRTRLHSLATDSGVR